VRKRCVPLRCVAYLLLSLRIVLRCVALRPLCACVALRFMETGLNAISRQYIIPVLLPAAGTLSMSIIVFKNSFAATLSMSIIVFRNIF